MGQKFISGNEHEEMIWDVERLWELAKDLPVQRAPIEEFSEVLDSRMWFGPEGITFRQFVDRVRAVNQADLSYPIILSAEGWIMDGRTRLEKTLLLGLKDIAVMRFSITPEPDQRRKKTGT